MIELSLYVWFPAIVITAAILSARLLAWWVRVALVVAVIAAAIFATRYMFSFPLPAVHSIELRPGPPVAAEMNRGRVRTSEGLETGASGR